MRRRRGPNLASIVFSLVVVLAVGGLAWGAMHGKSTAGGIGSAKDQAAARTTLQTGLQLPAGLVHDPTFTACGIVADACLTATTSLHTTLETLAAVVHSAGGSLSNVCSAAVTGGGTGGPKFACIAEGRLHGTPVLFLLGDGWSLPGHPAPQTAIVVNVEKSDLTSPKRPPGTPATAADVATLLPQAWGRAPQPCAAGATSSPPSSTTAQPSAPAATSSPTLLPASPPLPACSPTAITYNASVHLALGAASSQLAALALSKGYRLDGKPCIAGSTATSCGIWGERISAGVQELFVATLTDDGQGNTTGTLSVTEQKTPTA